MATTIKSVPNVTPKYRSTGDGGTSGGGGGGGGGGGVGGGGVGAGGGGGGGGGLGAVPALGGYGDAGMLSQFLGAGSTAPTLSASTTSPTDPRAPGSDVIGIGTLPGLTEEDYLAGDAQYQAQLAALMNALNSSTSDFEAQKSRYNTSYQDSLRGLGWTPGMQDDPSTPDINEAAPGMWNREDTNTASGRAYQNQTNDFASRGLLQSSLYGTAQDNLFRSLNDQLGGMQGAQTSFLDDIARQLSGVQNQNTLDQQNARAEALARRAWGLSLV